MNDGSTQDNKMSDTETVANSDTDIEHVDTGADSETADAATLTPSDNSVYSSSVSTESVKPTSVAAPAEKNTADMKWYVIHAYSGFEGKVKQLLEDRMRINGIENLFGDIIIPQETVTELVKGERKEVKKKFFPGYVIVQMLLNEHSWHLVKETPKVSGFVGGDTEFPEPLSDAEVQRIIAQVEHGSAGVSGKGQFEAGDLVTVKDGAFVGFRGTVDEVRPEKGKIRILISIFGREQKVDFDIIQVEKS
jgi:transcriptional antiterminator NusG